MTRTRLSGQQERVHWTGLQATGQHYRDGFYDQDEAVRSAREGAEETEREQEKL